MKLLILVLPIFLISCAYHPWRYESYYPIETEEYQSGYYKSDDYVMKISVIATEVEPDLRKSPYRLWIRYIDHTMAHEEFQICNLSVTTSKYRNFVQETGQCINLPLKTGSLKEGVEPYARSALFEYAEMNLDFERGEKLHVNFSYLLTGSNGEKSSPREIKLLFEPVLEKGLTKPCCLPSV